MALVFAALTPHPPLLLPTIGKEHSEEFAATRSAFTALAHELEAAKPETIIIISPHGTSIPDAVCMPTSQEYRADFTVFGDLITAPTWARTDTPLSERIRQCTKAQKLSLVRCTEEFLDYGSAIPLMFLTENLPDIQILPLLTSHSMTPTQHFSLGTTLRDCVFSSPSRIALIVSADLSHCVGSPSPEGCTARGVAYDQTIRDILASGMYSRILDITDEWDVEARTCATRPLALFFGLINGIHLASHILAYEKLFGTGYLTARFSTP